MIGNRVRLVLDGRTSLEGTLHSLKPEGVIIYPERLMPEQQSSRFIPMHRITEIIDRGRAP